MTKIRFSWLLWLCLTSGVWAASRDVSLDIARQEHGIAEGSTQVELFEDTSAQLTPFEVLQLERSRPAASPLFTAIANLKTLNGASGSAFWIRLRLLNSGISARRVHVALIKSGLNDIDYLVHNQQSTQEAWAKNCGESGPINSLHKLVRMPVFTAFQGAGECSDILIRVVGKGMLMVQPRLYFDDTLIQRSFYEALKEGAWIGGLLMLSIFSLFWLVLSRRWLLAWQTLGLFLLSMHHILSYRLLHYFIEPSVSERLVTLKISDVLEAVCPVVLMLYLHSLARTQKLSIAGLPVFIALGVVQLMVCLAIVISDQYILVQTSRLNTLVTLLGIVIAAIFNFKSWNLHHRTLAIFLMTVILGLSFRALIIDGMLPIIVPGTMQNINRLMIAIAVMLGLAFWAHKQLDSRQRNKKEISDLMGQQNTRLRKAVKRMTRTLNTTVETARHSNRQQTRLMAYIAHDLRAPMATIIGYAKALRSLGSTTHDKQIAIIERGAMHQLALIEEMLEHARGELHLFTVNPVALNLRDFLDDFRHHALTLAAQQNNTYVFELPVHFPHWVMLDGVRLQQVLLNLFSNAAKFTRNGRIALNIGARSEGPVWTLVFEIADTGTGIAEEDQRRIFGSFEQAQPTDGGLGLGLFIARRIVEQMGGQLTLRSVVGAGSVFRFEIAVTAVVETATTTLLAEQLMNAVDDRLNPNPPSVSPTADDDMLVALFATRPSPSSLAVLSLLAANGQWSDISDWLAQTLLLQPECHQFIAAVAGLLAELDFDGIRNLTRPDPVSKVKFDEL